MDPERTGDDGGLPLTRPSSVHSLRTVLKALDLPSMPPTAPLPPIPPSRKASTATSSTAMTTRTASTATTLFIFRPPTIIASKSIKYGTGKYANVELVPQPSDDPKDPLNWPQWKKEVNLGSLLFMTGLIGAMKTVFVSTSDVVAAQYNVSHTHVAALTAVPLMLSALTGFLSFTVAKIRGKRPVYLLSAGLVFAGSIWNSTAKSSYASCMGARVLQGLGWGAFDTLLIESIQDTFFEHEQHLRASIYNVVVATAWGSPVIGGAIAQSTSSSVVQYYVLTALFLIALPLLGLGAPESSFHRAKAAAAAAAAAPEPSVEQPAQPRSPCLWIVVRILRAFAAPTTILVTLFTMIPHMALWALSFSMAQLLPPRLSAGPCLIGALMAGPWVLSMLAIMCLVFHRTLRPKPTCPLLTATCGIVLSLVGLVTFGLHMQHMSAHSRLPLLSAQLGLVAAGAHVAQATIRPLLLRSVSFTASSMPVARCSVGNMHAAVAVLQNLVAGAFLVVAPTVLSAHRGVQDLVVGLGAAQGTLVVVIMVLWRVVDECVWKVDGRVMGLLDLRLIRLCETSFEA